MVNDNPAVRLYTILRAFQGNCRKDRSVQAAWALTLGVPEAEVTRALAGVAGLLHDIEQRVAMRNDPATEHTLRAHASKWAAPIFSPDRQMAQHSTGIVDDGALATLGTVAALLSATASEAVVPEDDALEGLREALQEALDEVRDDSETPSEVRTILLARLHDMIWALDHLGIVGPEGVVAAVERLAGAMVIRPRDRERPLVKRVLTVVSRAWTLFTFGAKAKTALEGWTDLLELPPGS